VITLDGHTWVTFDDALVGPWVCERAGLKYAPERFTGIGRIKDGQIVAGVLYEDCNGASVYCHIAGEGNWANKHFLWLIFDYPFNQLGVRRITTTVCPNNVRSQKFTARLGFEVEAKLKDAHPEGDIWVFRMFKENCRWIEAKDAIQHV